jgi:hypothetical protein
MLSLYDIGRGQCIAQVSPTNMTTLMCSCQPGFSSNYSDFFSPTPETCLVNRPARIAVYSISYVFLIVAIVMDCYRLVTIRQNLLFIPPSALIRDGRTVQIMQWMNLLHLVNESGSAVKFLVARYEDCLLTRRTPCISCSQLVLRAYPWCCLVIWE